MPSSLRCGEASAHKTSSAPGEGEHVRRRIARRRVGTALVCRGSKPQSTRASSVPHCFQAPPGCSTGQQVRRTPWRRLWDGRHAAVNTTWVARVRDVACRAPGGVHAGAVPLRQAQQLVTSSPGQPRPVLGLDQHPGHGGERALRLKRTRCAAAPRRLPERASLPLCWKCRTPTPFRCTRRPRTRAWPSSPVRPSATW